MSVADLSPEREIDRIAAPQALQFPLAFTPFERLMLLDDRPDYPMTIHVELGFTGRLDRTVFVAAMEQTIARHPLLAARIGWHGRWPYWLGPSVSPAKIAWHVSEPPLHPMRPTQIDLVRGPGVEAHVHVGAETTSVLTLFHHSCCDGQGARRFLFDLVSAYDRIALGEQSARERARMDTLLQERLRRRSEFVAGPERVVEAEGQTSFWEKAKNALTYVTTQPARLAGPFQFASASPSHGKPLVHNVLLEIDETANLRKRAQEEGATFNDVAVAKLMQVCADWNRRHEQASDSRHVRVCMPTDLRSKEDDVLPAANRTGYAFLTRRFGDTRDWSKLLASVRDETNYIKDYRVGLDFVTNMAVIQKVPLLLPLYLRYTRCQTTTVLTNLGDATRRLRRRFPMDGGRMVIGGCPLDFVKVTPPVRPGTRAGWGMCICGGRLAISLLTDPFTFSDDDTQQLLDDYVSSLRQWNNHHAP
jgi:NRPS condensation-like uncharacterized protein